MTHGQTATERFNRAREFLLQHRDDYERAYAEFRWPELNEFNWALDWFDVYARGNNAAALRIIADDGSEVARSFAELAETSNRVANGLRRLGVQRGDRVLMMLGNELPIWETMLAAQKLGAVLIPTTTQLTVEDLRDRVERGNVRHLIVQSQLAPRFAGIADGATKIAVGDAVPGWHAFEQLYASAAAFAPDGTTLATDPLLLYFTSGTTSKPKLVMHTHQSYPVGHLSTMYWVGIREGDLHQNISSPGWAKHAWSNVFAPWNAGATVLAHDYRRFEPAATLQLLERVKVNTLCAPPTVWRMLVQQLGAKPSALREAVSAGEPLNPEVIEQVQRHWHMVVRDGYGQTETTAAVGNSPGQSVEFGSMGKPLPGYRIVLLDSAGAPQSVGEIALALGDARPIGLMAGYQDDAERTNTVMQGGYYRTGDEAQLQPDGRLVFSARGDDVFKSSDYRISPFELESALIEHPSVVEAAVVPSPDAVRFTVPKAFVTLAADVAPDVDTARAIFEFVRARLAPYKRIRRLEFAALPKTISGKIRRVELRQREALRSEGERVANEFLISDFSWKEE